MDFTLFAVIDWQEMIEGWVQEWLPQLAGMGAGGLIFALITYAFAWFFIDRLRKIGIDEIDMPFFKLKSNKDVTHIITIANSDNIIVESMDAANKALEANATDRMHRLINRVVNKYLQKHKDNMEFRNFIQKTKLSLMFAVSTNHVINMLAKLGIEASIREKQDQAISMAGVDVIERPDVVAMIERLVKEFVVQTVPIQRALCENKIQSYRSAMVRLQMDGTKARTQSKIEKNLEFLEALNNINTAITSDVSGIIEPDNASLLIIDGAEMVGREIKKMGRIVDKLHDAGEVNMSSICFVLPGTLAHDRATRQTPVLPQCYNHSH